MTGISFDTLPDSKNEFKELGEQVVTVKSSAMETSKAGNPQLKVVFTTESGKYLNEFYQVNANKPFLMFKLKRLILAAGLELQGAEFQLEDLVKLIPTGTKMGAIISLNDNGYPQLDYKGTNKGLYTVEEISGPTEVTSASKSPSLDISKDEETFSKPAEAPQTTPTLDPEIKKELDDEDF